MDGGSDGWINGEGLINVFNRIECDRPSSIISNQTDRIDLDLIPLLLAGLFSIGNQVNCVYFQELFIYIYTEANAVCLPTNCVEYTSEWLLINWFK